MESLPLAEKPHLLQPNVRKDELFGIPKSAENSSLMEIKANQLGLTTRSSGPPSYAALLAKRPRGPEPPTAKPAEATDVSADVSDPKSKSKESSDLSKATSSSESLSLLKSDDVKISIVDVTSSLVLTK